MKILTSVLVIILPCSALSKTTNVVDAYLTNQKGMASWYGKENKKSSTGKKLTHKNPALAHKSLPIGTWVKVTSIRTNRSVRAIVEDRGPYTKNRIVDLNYPAAKELGIIKDGITKVKVEIIK